LGKKHPKVLFIPTEAEIVDFTMRLLKSYGEKFGCKTDVLYLLKTKPSLEQIREKILNSDIVYVGGGNTLRMLKRWRKLGVDKIIQEAYKKGLILS